MLHNTGEIVHSDLPIAGALRVIVLLKEILQFPVDAEVVLDVEQLLPVAVSCLFGVLELLEVLFLQALNDTLINGALIALVGR